nr:high mobility group B protein 10-like [Tanacetum cinerariifolium]
MHALSWIRVGFHQESVICKAKGNEKLSGFIYHLPSDALAPSQGTENMYQLAVREPSPPEQDSSGYNVFYSKHYGRLKPLYHGQEDVIRKRIHVLWETLTQEEQRMYQERCSRYCYCWGCCVMVVIKWIVSGK